jgi:hypothetical protein
VRAGRTDFDLWSRGSTKTAIGTHVTLSLRGQRGFARRWSSGKAFSSALRLNIADTLGRSRGFGVGFTANRTAPTEVETLAAHPYQLDAAQRVAERSSNPAHAEWEIGVIIDAARAKLRGPR